MESEHKKVITYSKVSSNDQKEDLKKAVLSTYNFLCFRIFIFLLIEDLGIGMNYKKKGLKNLIKFILSGQVSDLVLTHKDRLLRFGS